MKNILNIIPKKITICGYPFKVKLRKDRAGGKFKTWEAVIEIGTAANNHVTANSLIHEILEASLVQSGLRYDGDGNSEHLFCFKHSEFTTLCNSLTKSLIEVSPFLSKLEEERE